MLQIIFKPLHWARPKGRLLIIACIGAYSAPASAETLAEAMAAAYRYNPVLESGRSGVRAVDENVAIANSGFRPKITASGELSWEDIKTSGGGTTGGLVVGPGGTLTQGGINKQANYGVGITQPIFNGLSTVNQVRAAEAGVRGARELLRDTERNVLLQVVASYVSVIGAQEVLKAQEQNLGKLNTEFRVAKERVELTELTNTDLAQADLRRTEAIAGVASAKADLSAARAAYLNAVGQEPNQLSQPNFPAGLPKSLPEAQSIAANENPLLISALYDEQASRHVVDQIRGGLLPQLSIEANYTDEYNTNGIDNQKNTTVAGRLTVPIYEGGEVHASVRQAKHVHLSRLQNVEAVRSLVQQAVTTSWSRLQAAKTRVDVGRDRVRASRVALDGVRKEEGIGQRDLLDVLNAEQDILTSQVEHILAQRDYLIAAYDLLGQVGRLHAEHLSLDTEIYDPTVHYEEVRRKWFGINITYSDGRQEHMDTSGTEVMK